MQRGVWYKGISVLFRKNLDQQITHADIVTAGGKDAVQPWFCHNDQRQLVRVDIHSSGKRGDIVAEIVIADDDPVSYTHLTLPTKLEV